MMVLIFSGLEKSEGYTGNQLQAVCGDGDFATRWGNQMWEKCHGYIEGFWDTFNSYQKDVYERKIVCMHPDVTDDQLGKVVSKYLKNHPEKLHIPAITLILSSFLEAFPCPEEKEK